MRNGTRHGYQRYLCKLCGRVFREPGHEGDARPPFRLYRPLEALSALAHGRGEKRAHVAERLGVHRSRITQWLREHADKTVNLLEPEQVEDGRFARRTASLDIAPFTVSDADQELFLKASFGELRFWARQLKLFTEVELERYAQRVMDRNVPVAHRSGILNELRAPLVEVNPRLFWRLPV